MFRNHHSLIKSFKFALRGIKYALGERNFYIQLIIGFFAIVFALALKLSFEETAIIVILAGLVLTFEIINTAFEKTLDRICKEPNPEIGAIKDLTAAAVLIFSIAAFFVGLWIFIREIICK